MNLDALGIRKRLGREVWGIPFAFGPDGWRYDARDGSGRIIVTCSDLPEVRGNFVHASVSRVGMMPAYEDLKLLHAAVWPKGHAYQVFVPQTEHVNIAEFALHLWGRLDGEPMLPNFGWAGSI